MHTSLGTERYKVALIVLQTWKERHINQQNNFKHPPINETLLYLCFFHNHLVGGGAQQFTRSTGRLNRFTC
jgi:hypothetical protein